MSILQKSRRTKEQIQEDIERDAVKYYQDMIQGVQDMRRPVADIWEECKKMTDGHKDSPKYDWMSKIPVTDAHDAVSRIAAQYSSDIEFEADPQPDKEGNLDGDDEVKAKIMAAVVNSCGVRQMKLGDVLDTIKPGIPTYGTQYIKLALETELETRLEKKRRIKLKPSRKKNTNSGIAGVEEEEEEYTEVEKILRDERLVAYVPSVFDIYVRPDSGDLQKAPFIAERKIDDIRDLRAVAEKRDYKNLDKLTPGLERNEDANNDTSDSLRQYDFTTSDSVLNKHEVELFEVWGKVKKSWITIKDKDKDKWVEGYVLFGSGKNGAPVVIKAAENDEKLMAGIRPYVRFIFKRSPETSRQFGVGALEPGRGYHDMKGKLVDMLMDNGKMVWMGGFAVTPEVKVSQLKPRPRMVVRTANPRDDIMPLSHKDISGSLWKGIEFAEENFRRTTGVTDLQMGVEGGGTALETGIMQDNAAIFWQDVKRHYMDSLNELGNMVWKILIAKKSGTSEWVKVWDEDAREEKYVQWTPDDFKGKNYQLSVRAESVMQENNAVKANQLIKFADVFGDRMQLSPEEFRKLGKVWMKKQSLEQEADDVIGEQPMGEDEPKPPEPPMPPEGPMPPPMPPGPPQGPPPVPPAAGPMPSTPMGVQQGPQAGVIPPMQ